MMLKYIIRLDDACSFMIKEKWDRIEKLLDKYDIKPIVGIIPKCEDEEFINNPLIENFWENYALKWQNKKWIIALHGLNHSLSKKLRTEFSNKTYNEQRIILERGYKIFADNGIVPICFFAPNHTFDNNTIKALHDLKIVKFISDGYAIYPYKYNDMLFLPSVFDTPHKLLPFGVWTFVCHPNNMSDSDFEYLERFINSNVDKFSVDIDCVLAKYKNRKRNIFDFFIEKAIFLFRKVRSKDE